MLILSRRKGEGLQTSNGIKFKILKTIKGEVSIGIEAPDEVDIWRDELDHESFLQIKKKPEITVDV